MTPIRYRIRRDGPLGMPWALYRRSGVFEWDQIAVFPPRCHAAAVWVMDRDAEAQRYLATAVTAS